MRTTSLEDWIFVATLAVLVIARTAPQLWLGRRIDRASVDLVRQNVK